jgi:hypothetical protein
MALIVEVGSVDVQRPTLLGAKLTGKPLHRPVVHQLQRLRHFRLRHFDAQQPFRNHRQGAIRDARQLQDRWLISALEALTGRKAVPEGA